MKRAAAVLLTLLVPGAGQQVRFTDITPAAGISFRHQPGAQGRKLLPETLGPGCVFFDFDGDLDQDLLIVNGGPPSARSKGATPLLYRNDGNNRFTDVTRRSGLDVPIYGLGAAAADFDNDGRVDLFITAVGQSRLFHNLGNGRFADVTARAGLAGRSAFSSSALWFDYDRDGLVDLFVANYVQWTPESDIWCSFDGKSKSYCTPEAYRGSTSWLFRNTGNGRFADVTAKARLFDTSSKSLGAAVFDYDRDGWPDLFVANDTQPNKLYRNNHDGTFTETALKAGLAFSEDGKARAGMGVDAADFSNSGRIGIAVTNFDNEMLGLYQSNADGVFRDSAFHSPLGSATRRSLGFACFFFDANLDGWLDLFVLNGHIDPTVSRLRSDVSYQQPPHLFLNHQGSLEVDSAPAAGVSFARPKVGRGAAYADIDLDGDLDIALTTNQGPAFLYRNDQPSPRNFVRLWLEGTKSNRDAIGAVVQFKSGPLSGTRVVRTGSSYLSQSELPLTIGLGAHTQTEIHVIWPSGARERHPALKSGGFYHLIENKGLKRLR